MMKYFLDTEFYEHDESIELISIGIVSEDNRRFYAETKKAKYLANLDPWLIKNVDPYLKGPIFEREELKDKIIDFIGNDVPEFWGYYCDYDWVVFCQLFGRMIALPRSWPMYCLDLKQLQISMGVATLPKQKNSQHYALADALWIKETWKYLNKKATRAII